MDAPKKNGKGIRVGVKVFEMPSWKLWQFRITLKIEKADKLIESQKETIGINSTRINPTSSSSEAPNPQFAAMERDAEERYQRKVWNWFLHQNRPNYLFISYKG